MPNAGTFCVSVVNINQLYGSSMVEILCGSGNNSSAILRFCVYPDAETECNTLMLLCGIVEERMLTVPTAY